MSLECKLLNGSRAPVSDIHTAVRARKRNPAPEAPRKFGYPELSLPEPAGRYRRSRLINHHVWKVIKGLDLINTIFSRR